ncbi:uncharacterized protein UTRI_03751_B [Ustilago trichophora]|uniref:Arrestin C-terminal-like domain-containing protein n=1 Tax=Ustilago trichophora TaxID=86804 RepID=A0A5C3DZP8_9BASI|nr:uncharacterized protein UTRI_03751_B [Ustilago trichophora]
MFAPPSPIPASRPASAAGHSYHHQQPYDMPRSPLQHENRLHRSNSFSWKHELGLPPPPSEIDALGDSLHQALVPHNRPASRARSVSPAVRAPSRYDLEFGGLEDPAEQRDRTQDHMNMVTKHPKVKIDVVLSSNVFEAGASISGKVELTCTTSQRLRLGHIAIELEAVEQLTSRDHAATQLFLYNRTMFQGDNLPPSNAVLPAAPVNGYWTARKGRTTFPFSFRLPSSAPSCITFAANASLRYGLKATAQTWYNDDKMVVTARREAFVLEKWSDQFHPRFREPIEAVGDTRLFMGGNGAVWLEAGVTEQLFWGGGQMLVRCGIKNNTKRHLSGIKVALARRLIFPVGSVEGFHDSPEKVSLEPRITEIVHDQIFKGREYEFGPNAESVCTVAVDVPRDLRTVRKTRLFEVRTFALVSLLLGSFAKDLTVEIPIYVAHTASGQAPPRDNLDNLHTSPPMHSLPQRPHSSMGHSHISHPQHHLHHHHQQQHHTPPAHHHGHNGHHDHHGHAHAPQMDHGMLQVERLAAERGWSPAPMLDANHRAGPARPASTAPGMIQLPAQAQPFALGPDGHLEWNPAANGWNASRLMTPAAAAGSSIQRSASAAPDVFHNVARPHSATSAPMDPVAAWTATQRSMSASPGPALLAQHTNFAPPPSMPSPQMPSAPMGDRRMSLPAQGPYGGAPPQQVAYQNAPQESLPPMPEPQTIARAPVQQQYSAPPPQPQGNAYSPAPPIAGLATIEEDSESQAGTIKTLQKLPTIGKTGTKGAAGNSVSRNNIEQFEAMAEAEEDEEEVKRQMIAMGMQPDEDAFSSRRGDSPDVPASRVVAEAPAETHAASSSRRTDASQASSTSTYRPRASDIFQTVSHAQQPQSPPAEQAQRTPAPVETVTANVGRSQDTAPSSELRTTDDSQSAIPRRPSVVSLRRSSSSHGIGLQALETNLVRSTTPKITTSSRAVVTMANVARPDSSSSPLASPSVGHEDSTRSRKNSALRAAALAREEAERKSAEEQARAAEERERQLQVEQARQAAAAEKGAAQREAARIRAAEQQRLERERIAEHARRQRELREQEEEQRFKAAEAERVAREQELKRQEEEQREEAERRSRQAAEALATQKRAESRRLADIAAIKSSASSERLDRINAAIGNPPSSIAPSVPSKTTAPTFAAPGKMSDRDRVALKRQAVHRIDGWLSSAASPNPSHMETPGTPSASVLSVMRKEPEPSTVLNDEARSSFAYRSPSQVINPLWEGRSSRSQANEGAMPKSRTMADLTSTKASAAAAAEGSATGRDEPIPQLSAELRALVDSSEIRPARKSGTALKEHPISRRLSGLGSTEKMAPVVGPAASVNQKSSEAKRERHTSMPSWPRPGMPGSDVAGAPATVVPPSSSSSNVHNSNRVVRNPEAREVGIPSRVEKTLMAPTAEGTTRCKDEPGYDARSARGGRGGRVASVAQLWSKIAGDDEVAAADAGRSSLTAPQTDSEPRSASPSSASTVKPKARRSSNAAGGAPALDFSKKAMTSSASVGVTTIAATFGGCASSTKPESLKSFTAPQFLNTSVSKPVFAKPSDHPAPAKTEKRPLPKPVLEPGAVPAPQLVRPTAMRPPAAADRPSRRISTQLLSTFEKEKTHKKEEASVREMMSKVAVDSTILGALQSVDANHELSTLRCADGTEAKIAMSGRGTTKAIGENKLKSLRAVWGS